MKLKTYLFSKGIILSDLKRFWWVGAIYTILLFLAMPLQYMMLELPLKEDWHKNELVDSLHLSAGSAPFNSFGRINVQALLICTLPIFLAAMLFSYLHSSRAATMFHSLPLKRNTLLCSHTAAGIMLISAPVLLISLILAGLALFTGLGEYYTILNVVEWAGLTLLFNLLFFSIAVFVGMFTGNAIAHIIFTYILNVLPYGIYILAAYNMKKLLNGFCTDSISDGWAKSLPFIKTAAVGFDGFTPVQGLLYLMAAVAFLAASDLAYGRRNVESAGNIVAFKIIRPVFKYGFTACLMLLGGFITGYFYHSDRAAVIAACFVSAFAGYWISQAMLEKSLRVWHAYKGCLVFNGVVILLLAGIFADVTGYVRYIPKASEIESAYFGQNFIAWRLEKEKRPEDLYFRCEGLFKEGQNINGVMSLHRMLAESGSTNKGQGYYVAYILKDGRSIVRKYTVDKAAVRKFAEPLYESLEYKEDKYPVLSQKARDIKVIEIGDRRASKKPLILSDAQQIQSFLEVMKKELVEADYEEITEPDDYTYIRITDRDDRNQEYSLRRSFTAISRWLEQKGYYKSVMLVPEDIDHVKVLGLDVEFFGNNGYSYKESGDSTELSYKSLVRELIDLCRPRLDDAASGWYYELEFYSRADAVNPDFSGFINADADMSNELHKILKGIKASLKTVE